MQGLQRDTTKQIKKLEDTLTYENSKGIDVSDLCDELQAVARRVSSNSSPKDVLHFIYTNTLRNSVPIVCIVLRILLTLPDYVASGERIF